MSLEMFLQKKRFTFNTKQTPSKSKFALMAGCNYLHLSPIYILVTCTHKDLGKVFLEFNFFLKMQNSIVSYTYILCLCITHVFQNELVGMRFRLKATIGLKQTQPVCVFQTCRTNAQFHRYSNQLTMKKILAFAQLA